MKLEDWILRRILVADGAMGSELIARNPGLERLDLAVLEAPRTVLEIHLDYLKAGARLIETATFTSSRPRLEKLPGAPDPELANGTAVKLARDAVQVAGVEALVGGSMGPLAAILDIDDPLERSVAKAAYAEQAAVLAARGVDLIVLETFFRLDDLILAVEAVRSETPLPILASMTFPAEKWPNSWEDQAAKLVELSKNKLVDAVGVNCSPGPLGTLELLEKLPRLAKPISVQPNAGVVLKRSGREIHSPATPSYLARFAQRAVQLGASIVGGCCGTGPEHIRAMAKAVAELKPEKPAERPVHVQIPQLPHTQPKPRKVQKPASTLAEKLATGRFVKVVQLDPPKGTSTEAVLNAAKAMKATGAVDAVDINSNPLGRLRMDSLWLAAEIQAKTNMETIPHVTCRDASLMGLESQLLGAWRWGIRNLLAITGDPSHLGDYPGAGDVYQVDVFELVRAISRMSKGEDHAGNPIGNPPNFNVGVAFDPNAPDLSVEVDRLKRKVEAGASFLMSQVFFEWSCWERALEAMGGSPPVPALLAIWPLTSFRLALRLHNEVPGIVVPAELLKALEEAGPDAPQVGRDHAAKLLEEAPAYCQGVYIVAPFKKPSLLMELLPEAFKP